MDMEVQEMEFYEGDSEGEFEVITLNPNVDYESDSSVIEVSCQNLNKIQPQIPPSEEKLQEVTNEIKSIISLEKLDEISCDSTITPIEDDNSMNSCDLVRKVRKKLNLQEYKMRRANEISQEKPLFDVPRRIAAFELCDVPTSLPLLVLPTDPNFLAQKENTEVKKKEYFWNTTKVSFNPDLYEEIVRVSIGCNTEVTIPPIEEKEENDETKPASKFLKNIVNNLNKDDAGSLLNSSTTLFSSIQAVVQKKCISTETENTSENMQICENSEEPREHGEDKTIMHLRKDRLRPFKCSVGLQTDNIPLFPPLLLSPLLVFNRIRNARNYRRKISRSRSRSRSFSPSYTDRARYQNNRYSRSQHSTHSSSMNSSGSESDSGTDSEISGASSSRSSSSDSLKRFNKRQNFKFYSRNQTYQEERKIVYIGGLEEETTKDEIRRKFLEYGTIKKISFHLKDDGLRYGFVTFAEASSAYEVLDKFSKDPLISKYDIRFGGRRHFCKQTYADLDSIQDSEYVEPRKPEKDLSFEELLKMAKKQISSKK